MSGENQGDGAPSSTAVAPPTSENVAATTTTDPATTIQQPTMGEKPTTVSTVAFEGYLLETLLNLQCRAEVEATVQDLVTDVEVAVDLQDQLSAHTYQEQAERIIAEQEYALEETHVVQKDRLKAQTLLADALVKDLWGLSKEVGSLLELKQKHQAMILEYDELMAKLAQAEEDLYAARRNPQPQQQPQSAVVSTAVAAPVSSTTEKQPPPPPQKPAPTPVAATTATVVQLPPQAPPSATIVKLPEKTAPLAEKKSETTPDQKPPAALTTDPDEKETPPAPVAESKAAPSSTGENPSEKALEEAPPAAAATSPKQAPQQQQQSPPVVALVEDDDDDNADGDAPVGTLENIDMEILMRIFGFLDAIDILNTAQSNISMYSRVDSLFGFSMDGGGGDDNASTTSTLATTPTVAAATAGTSATASVSTAATTKSAPAAASATKKTAAPAEANNPIFGQRLLGGGGRNIFNMLQSGVAGATGASGPSAPAAAKQQSAAGSKGRGGAGRSGGDTNDGKPPLSAAMANSMAAKLNDAEINAIISMTEKLRSKEKQVSLLIKDKEEAEGKLKGSEAVKDFLINKVRDMEKIMNKSEETEKKVTQQIASDQEVIAFLDGRVQELERTTRIIQKEKNAAQEELKAAKSQNDKKVAVLSDMLQFERQKVKENERDWKATKKLLVKEVKTCRVQIVALQAERDGFREQNDVLRKAVMSGGNSNKF